ncbi:sigma-70 family RNA polymerase sigma factor [Curtobacterium sp. VKM Ac-2922]|uniref:sigma-70 family RNA polymerase sigma factor n=1 Tax=Curtobacterium sp. VKM Ac-2922 TaxID=2929475 RepID=UPI001FB2E34E|nr:sigma-70 family RNA polymerase sigma factor [Curtobacterium sp. VKM Ac-2922]MCJ1712894.1 sigma-70 family RNA polymerase sigma factor [Curtobacterium sp. VKM Ac-2922]
MGEAEVFEHERRRLVNIASRILDDRGDAEDVVQLAWFRFHATTDAITNVPAWLTTVTTRLCLDRLRARVPVPMELHDDLVESDRGAGGADAADPAQRTEHREAVGQALGVVLDELTPTERVAWVLHEVFAFDFTTIGTILDRTPEAARKLASRARARLADAERDGVMGDAEVVDAFMSAARGGDLGRLLSLLAPGATVGADPAAIAAGTPRAIDGREAVAAFFDGSARAAVPALVGGRPGAAWFHRGRPMVAFDFTVVDGLVEAITFRADPAVLTEVVHRRRSTRGAPVTFVADDPSNE